MRSPGFSNKMVEADLLIIGGGIAGCFAAIEGLRRGLNVVLFDKENIERSGSAGGGLRHWSKLPPEGVTPEEIIGKINESAEVYSHPRVFKGLTNENQTYFGVKDNWDCVHILESVGLDMHWEDGQYLFVYDPTTREYTNLRFPGAKIKKKLADYLRRSQIMLFERTMGVDLLTKDGTVVGAVGLNVRNGELIVCKSRATLLATGKASRIYHPETGPSGRFGFLWAHYPGSGDGHAMAFRVGAELVNMEIATRTSGHASLPYDFKAIKFGAIYDLKDAPYIFDCKGNKVAERSLAVDELLEIEKAGNGPCYYDFTHLSEEAHKWIAEAPRDEMPLVAVLTKERGLDTRKDRYLIADHKKGALMHGIAGVLIDENGRTSLKGLYAAGDMAGAQTFSGAQGAAVFGRRAAIDVAEALAERKPIIVDEEQVRQIVDNVLAPLRCKEGVEPLDVEMRLRDIVDRYCGVFRSEGRLNEGLWRLNSVKEKFLPELKAKNPHELMRAPELRNLFTVAELHLLSARERKESGLGNVRLDYPEKKNDPWKEAIVIKKEKGEVKLARRRMPSLKPDYKKK